MSRDPDRAPRILIVRLSALGDVVHCLPLLDVLRRARPEAEIGWLVEEKAASLLRGHPQIDRLWVLPRAEIAGLLRRGRVFRAARRLWSFVRELRAARYEITIDPQCNLRSAAAARSTGARRRIGFSRRFAKEGAHLWLTERVEPRPDRRLKVERNLELLRALGIDGAGARPQVAIPEGAREWARASLAKLGGERVIALHPGVSASGAIKRWEPERYAATARRLRDEAGICSVVTWGPGELELAQQVVSASDGAAQLGPQTSSILELAALLSACPLVVSGDTGPLHLAAALGVPVVGLYGPKDPAIYGPWYAHTDGLGRVVRRPVHCSPCTLRQCPNVICMPAIQVEDVVQAVLEELGEPTPAAAMPEPISRR